MVLTHLEGLSRMVLDILFPARCVSCNREGAYICHECFHTIRKLTPPVCPVCNLPVSGKRQCDCRYWKSLDGLSSPFVFQGPIRQAILQFKYYNLRAIAPLLGKLMCEHYLQRSLTSDVFMPVPLHNKRLRQRGYNQSALLADEMCRATGIDRGAGLVKNRYTPSQVKTPSMRARRANIETAFRVTGNEVAGKRVMVVDDVATTGATLDACAGALKKAGATVVRGLTLAREI